jgi:fatty-acyl-CoA synthase
MRPAIRNADDLLAIEAAGLDAFWTYRTPFAILEAQAKADPDAVAILYLRDGAGARTDRLTYGELARGVRRAANLFRRLGLDQDRSVAILMPQGIQGQIALWGAELAGRAFPVNPMLRPDHLATLARAAQARLAVVLGRNDEIDYWSAATSALRDAGCVTHILAGDADAPTDGADGDFADLCSREDGERLTFTPDERPETIAACFHTGGTTGAPKLALHSKGNQAFVASAASAMYAMHAGDVIVNGFPIFHVAGSFVYGLCAIAAGATQVIPTRLGMRTRGFVDDLWRHIERNRVTILGCVPTIMSALNSIPCNADIGSLRMSLTGGSALPGELCSA